MPVYLSSRSPRPFEAGTDDLLTEDARTPTAFFGKILGVLGIVTTGIFVALQSEIP